MNISDILERRRLRRRVGWWRAVAIIIAVVLVALVYRVYAGPSSALGRPHIAELSINGLVVDDEIMLETIREIGDDPSARALIVSLSTGGGTTYGGEVLYKAIRAVAEKKPVVSEIRGEAASAGYMIALAGDRIFAGNTSITGSIGVLFMYPQAKELLDKLGVSVDAVKSAPLKAEPSPFTDASPEAQDMVRALVMDTYDWFVDLVAERRAMPREAAFALADGRILTGRQALEAGLIDEIGNRDDIRAFLADQGVDGDLEIRSWDGVNRDEFGFNLAWVAGRALETLGLGGFLRPDMLEQLGLVDGLLSVGQSKW
ncbi:signal peptide peptidase SppA [Martelella endophytica]|uniref:Clp protease n=1 Tax=Martelella endophytica TaxID=1486262 RepID=A0A0D5LWL4_MAREN|nr:signal peptide peptidase SppA [Martelella endophytica]AJY48376.1 Clp protease [Martelella endophytica]